MKYLQDTEGRTLPIPDTVYLFKRTVSFITWSIRGDFSTDFTVPNDSETRKTLGYTSLNQVDRPTQKAFRLFSNGNVIADGRVFIKGVSDEFELFFVSGNTNWINLITGSIKDIDLSAYDTDFDGPTIDSRRNATEGVIFPVIDWYSNYRKMTNAFVVKPVTGVSVDSFYELYPCFHQKTILSELFKSYGLKIGGNLLDDPIYNSLVLTPEQIRSAAYEGVVVGASGVFQSMRGVRDSPFGQAGQHQFNFDSGTSFFDDSLDVLLFPSDIGNVVFTYSYARLVEDSDQDIEITLRKNGTDISSFTVAEGELNGSFSIITEIEAGDEIDMIGSAPVVPLTYTVEVTASLAGTLTGVGAIVSDIVPDVEQFDFIRHIAQRFNCLVDYDEFTQMVSFTLLDSLKKSDAIDLSEKVLEYKQIPSSGYGKRNYIRATPAEELTPYKSNDLNYGDALVESDGDEDKDVIQTIFRPAETFINSNLEWLITSIPLVRLEDADTGTPFDTISAFGGNVSSFTDTTSGFLFSVDEVVRIESTLYNGFAVALAANPSTFTPYGNVPYLGNDTGKIYKQKIVFPFCGSRELVVVRDIEVNSINTGSQIYGDINLKIEDEDGSYPVATTAWAFYAKPNINTALDQVRVGLNYGPVVNTSNIPFGTLYNKTLKKIIQGGQAEVTILLTETEYYNLVLASYFFIRTKDFEGYFIAHSIDGYTDSNTPITLQLTLTD